MIGLCQCMQFNEELSIEEKQKYTVILDKIVASILPLCIKDDRTVEYGSTQCCNIKGGKVG